MKSIYMDYAATTPVDPRVIQAMKPYFSKRFGNASTLYKIGHEADRVIENSRNIIADMIKAKNDEIIFTSGGTESNNIALKGVAFANKDKGRHIIVSKIEHHAILEPCSWLEKQGFEITHLPVDKFGLVDISDLEKNIRKDTILVSIMHGNNEIGTIEPIEEIGKICNNHDVLFHTDAVQSFGKEKIDVNKMNIDMLSASSHKIYGPKGVGMLYIKKGINIDPLFHGGGQEFNLRSGTENVAGIVGFGKATDLANKEMEKEKERLTRFRNKLIKNVLKIENSHLNGHPVKRLSFNSNFWFAFIEGESLIIHLDMKGVSASTGSACSSNSLEPSHVLLAIGLRPEEAHGSLRLTMGRWTKKEGINYIIEILPEIIGRLREISPFKGRWK